MKKIDKNKFIVILAGGSGTRFWPLSRKSKPKQFLNVVGDATLFEQTLQRISSLVIPENIFVVTNQSYKQQVMDQSKNFKVPSGNVMCEPLGKNTAPAICWASSRIYAKNKQANIAFLPSDHLILREKKFLKILNEAFQLAESGYLMTLGLVPNRPDTGFGYLKSKVNTEGIYKVEKFREKPDLKTAKILIQDENYFWNSGMFIWKAEVILEKFQHYLPEVYNLIGEKYGMAHINKVWSGLPNVSIDYGILEKDDSVALIPAQDIGWSDLGSWESLTEVVKADRDGNILKGDVLTVNTKNTYVYGQKKLIATIGLDNIVIVDTPEALLVCRKDRSQHVKDIVEQLKKKNRSEI